MFGHHTSLEQDGARAAPLRPRSHPRRTTARDAPGEAIAAVVRAAIRHGRARLRAWHREHAVTRTVAALERLDDAMLHDIGLDRTDIRAAATRAVDGIAGMNG